MTEKITLKVTELITGPSGIKIEKVDFPTGKGNEKTEITEIFFVGREDKQIENAFEVGKSYEMEFELSEVDDDRMPVLTAMHSASSVPAGGPPNKLVLESDKKLRIVYHKNDTIKFQEKAEEQTPPPTPDPDPKPGPGKPENPDQPSPSPNEGPDSPEPKKPDQNPAPQAPTPKNQEPTSEEVSQTKSKLKQAQESGDKDQLKSVLEETNDIVKRSSDSDLKKIYSETEDKLGQLDKKELRNIIKEQVAKELQKLGIKTDDLSPENKQKLDELNNNNNNNNNNNINPDEAKNIRTEILNEAGMTALDNLINEVEQAIKSGNAEQIKTKVEKLKQFTEDSSDEYAQNAYQLKKEDIKKLLEKAEKKNKSDSNKNNEEGFLRLNNPLV